MTAELPAIISGPIIRHTDQRQLTFWLVTSRAYQLSFQLIDEHKKSFFDSVLTAAQDTIVAIGRQAFVHQIVIGFEHPLPQGKCLYYHFGFIEQGVEQSLVDLVPSLVYPGQKLPSLVIKPDISQLLHGSCRKPHFDSDDGLCQVDHLLAEGGLVAEHRPSLLMMSGDQIYADDVAGPMLVAIHQLIKRLGLYDEVLTGATVSDSQALYNSQYCYYQRHQCLPRGDMGDAIVDRLFASKPKPIFTSDSAENHLVTLAEVLAMYLLVWSPSMWPLLSLDQPALNSAQQAKFDAEKPLIESFVQGLAGVQRALAHLPVYMIFDDHDITDDWNLTRGWEEAAYGHAFSKRILGNAMIGYWLCQGWGNAPKIFDRLTVDIPRYFNGQGYAYQDELIDRLLSWNRWHYSLQTLPKMLVLDTRTQRWRSESRANKPSGLMDWESLSELQQNLIGEETVIMVSAAPIYGVKVIETIQKIFTLLGKPLLVDAENWMAHKGTANVMLNIFQHVKTPPNFIILSGDVHYSFVYEVRHRFRRSRAKIYQITCSGIKNEFPARLLAVLDTLNHYLYARYSPLNMLTKRRRMKIKVRQPSRGSSRRLYNGSGIGVLDLSADKQVIETSLITAQGEIVRFDNAD